MESPDPTPAKANAGGDPAPPAESLLPLQAEAIEVFVRLARLFGQPKSVGEIYGLIYISPEPMPMDVIASRLNLSKGSTSQGLRLLKGLGAVRPIYQVGDRRDFYTAETSLKKLVGGYLDDAIIPLLNQGQDRLAHLQRLLEEDGGLTAEQRVFFDERVNKLNKWHERAHQLFPLIRKFLGTS
ncbi:MAG: hypothetical protein AAGK14_11335 [Verrucomicrobiota bacterium]